VLLIKEADRTIWHTHLEIRHSKNDSMWNSWGKNGTHSSL